MPAGTDEAEVGTTAELPRYGRVYRFEPAWQMLHAAAPGGQGMPQVEIFTPTGVVSGSTARAAVGSDAKGAPTPLPVDASRWYPLDGSAPERRGSLTVGAEEILIVILAPPPFTVHASWYPIELEVGPYRLEGRLPVAPGFDPARALARPAGAFVALRDVSISLTGRDEAGIAERAYAHVNRYAVDRIASSLMLGFFFPGATHEPFVERGVVPQIMPARSPSAA